MITFVFLALYTLEVVTAATQWIAFLSRADVVPQPVPWEEAMEYYCATSRPSAAKEHPPSVVACYKRTETAGGDRSTGAAGKVTIGMGAAGTEAAGTAVP